LRLDGLAGTIDGEPFSGTLGLDYAAKPRLTADLRFDALTLTGAEGARPAAPNGGLTVAVDADLIPDPSWFEPFDAKASLAFKRLTLGGLRLEGAAVAAIVKEGGLDLTLASEAAYAGTARARYVLARAGDGGRHQLSLSLNRARALPLLADLAGVRGLDGTASARIDVQATGRSLDGLLRSAKGLADLSVADGRLDGLDLAGLIGLVPGRAAPRDEAGGDGFLRTRLGFLGGSFGVADGRAVTNDLALRTNVLEAKGAGSLDLVERTLDFRLTPTLIAPGAGRGRRGLDVPIRVTGPWADPSATADLSGIARDPGSAIDALQGLGESLFGGDGADPGGDLGAGLGGLLDAILPKPRERPAPGPRRP
jgi:AsmA protein